MRVLGAALIALAIAAATPRVDAQERRPVVVLVRPTPSTEMIDEMLGRTRAELLASGFDARIVEGAPEAAPRAAIEAADADAIAAIAIVDPAGDATVEVWVDDRLSGKVSIRPLVATGKDEHKAAAVLAIQAVELLRASLVEIARPPAPPDEAAPPPPTGGGEPPPAAVAFARGPEPAPRPRAELSLAAGPSAILGFDPATLQVAPSLALALTAPAGLGGRLRWIGPGLGPELDVPGGTVSLSSWLLTAGVLFAPRTEGRLFGFAALDGGVLRLTAEGTLEEPAEGRTGSSLVAAFLAGGGGGVRLTDQAAIVAEGQVLVTAPRISVVVDGDEVVHAGRPGGVLTLGLQLSR